MYIMCVHIYIYTSLKHTAGPRMRVIGRQARSAINGTRTPDAPSFQAWYECTHIHIQCVYQRHCDWPGCGVLWSVHKVWQK